ncbi:LysR family transcriptional regulator [Pseudorhodoferax sp. LjRoot39]|uniref:LysR family transcriptional regulator n=1 Tax=Pseudorhodoferax sp. LjRoot39 TaxID=3342328 RepID=UPI003ECD797C
MNLKQMATLAAVAELGSVSRAATALGQAQSLVSRQVAQLEQEWGDRLFARTGRGVALTDFGRQLMPQVHRVLAEVEQLGASVHEAAGALTGTVYLGVLPTLSGYLLPQLLAALQAEARGVRLCVTEGFSGDLDEQLGAGRLDMIVVNRYGTTALRGEDALGVIDTCLLGAPQLPLMRARSIGLRQLDGLPLVLPALPNGMRSMLDQLAVRHCIAIDVVMEVDTATAMKGVAASGQAYTLLPAMAAQAEIAQGLLAAVPVVRPAIKRTIALGLTRQRPVSRAARFVATRVRQLAVQALTQQR